MDKKTLNKPKGDAWVWFTSLGLTTGLVMVTAIMIFIFWQGIAAFWPSDVALLKLKADSTARVNGNDYIAGELIKTKERFDEKDGVHTPVTEQQYFIANRDLYNISFRYVDVNDIESTSYPKDIMVLERLNDSRALVYAEKLTLADGIELLKDDPKFYDTYAKLVHESEEERAVILAIEKNKIAPVTKKNTQLEIDQYPYLEKLRNNNETLKAIQEFKKQVSFINSTHSGFMAY